MTGARKALIVASDTYEHEGLRRLRSPQADADALAAVLADPQVGDFEVEVVHNQPSHEVQARIEDLFTDSRPEDLLLLHLACHGVKNDAGELYFATRNTRLDRLASTAVSADFVQRGMRVSRSRSIVLLLDCCYGGAFGRGVSVRAAGPVDVLESFPGRGLDGGRGRAVITASTAMEYAFEGDALTEDHSAPTSVFTDALVRGLATGEADLDEDGWVSLNELYDYVFDRVRTTTPGQTPTRDVEMQGELYLARSRRRRVRAAPMPPDLLAASHDANAFTRLGAVSELRARLLGGSLPSAAGAFDRLREIADADIRYVADAAAAALAEASLTVEPAEVAFGDVPHGADPPRLAVTVHGPPFARTCTCESSDRRVLVRETPDGLEVSLDTSRPGTVEGVVTVTGPTGAAHVPVHAQVTPAAPLGGPAQVPAPADVPAPDETAVAHAGPPRTAAPREPEPGPPAVPGHPRSRPRPPWAPVAAAAALTGSGLLAAGAVSPFQWDSPLRDAQPELVGHALVLAGLVSVTAVLLVAPRTRRPVGVGLLLGAVATSTWGLVVLWTAWWNVLAPQGGTERGFGLMLAGHLAMLLAGALAVRELGRGLVPAGTDAPDGPLARLRRSGPTQRLLVATGLLGAAAMVVKAADPAESEWDWATAAWVAVLAAGLPLAGAVTWRSGPGRWLVLGWAAGGTSLLGAYLAHHARLQPDSPSPGTGAVLVLGASLVLLAVTAVVAVARDRRDAATRT